MFLNPTLPKHNKVIKSQRLSASKKNTPYETASYLPDQLFTQPHS